MRRICDQLHRLSKPFECTAVQSQSQYDRHGEACQQGIHAEYQRIFQYVPKSGLAEKPFKLSESDPLAPPYAVY